MVFLETTDIWLTTEDYGDLVNQSNLDDIEKETDKTVRIQSEVVDAHDEDSDTTKILTRTLKTTSRVMKSIYRRTYDREEVLGDQGLCARVTEADRKNNI